MTFEHTLTCDARIAFIHPEHNFALLCFDTSNPQLESVELTEVPLSERSFQHNIGDYCSFVGMDEFGQVFESRIQLGSICARHWPTVFFFFLA